MMNSRLIRNINKANQSKEDMLMTLANTEQDQLLFKPDLQNWNMLQVAEHCKNIESSVLYMLNKYRNYPFRPTGIKEGFNAFLLKLALNSGIKFKVPPIKNLIPEGKNSLKKINDDWNEVRIELEKYLENFPDERLNHTIFKHPSAGFLNIINTVDFIHNHTKHHQKQIERLKKAFKKENNK